MNYLPYVNTDICCGQRDLDRDSRFHCYSNAKLQVTPVDFIATLDICLHECVLDPQTPLDVACVVSKGQELATSITLSNTSRHR